MMAAGTQLTTEWLEFEIYVPGQPARIDRREIFDLIGPAMRKERTLKSWKLTEKQRLERAFHIAGVTEILPLACGLTSEFIQERAAPYVLLHRDIYMNLVENYRNWEPEELFEEMAKIKPLSAKLYGLALKRFSLSPLSGEVSLTSPNVLARHSAIVENERGELVKMETLDIIANDVSVIGKVTDRSFSVCVEQGILDTLIEVSEMKWDGAVDNAAYLFLESRGQGVGWTWIRNVDELSRKRLRFPADVLARLEKQLSRGFLVLVPEKEISLSRKTRFAWWRLNPETGNFLGFGEKWVGQAMSEYAEKAEIVLQLKSTIEYYADIGRCSGGVMSAALFEDQQEMRKIVVRCIWMAVCTNAAGVAEGLSDIDIETNWTNLIIKATLDWAMGSLCEGLWEEIEREK